MELIILLAVVTSVATNLYLIKKLSSWFNTGFIELEVEALEPKVWEPLPPIESVVLDVTDAVQTVTANESAKAWRNATGLPAAGPASPSPHRPLPPPGPQERPYGFV